MWGWTGGFGPVKSTSRGRPEPSKWTKIVEILASAVQPAATLWQVCGAMPATPEAIKSTADAAGHAGENRNSFINLGFAGLEVDSIMTFPL